MTGFSHPDLLCFYRVYASPSNATASIYFLHLFTSTMQYKLVPGVNQGTSSLKGLKSETPGRVSRKMSRINPAVSTTISDYFIYELPQNLFRQGYRRHATQNQLTDHCSKLATVKFTVRVALTLASVIIYKTRTDRQCKVLAHSWEDSIQNKPHCYSRWLAKHTACLLVQCVRLRATFASYVS